MRVSLEYADKDAPKWAGGIRIWCGLSPDFLGYRATSQSVPSGSISTIVPFKIRATRFPENSV
jgi:hypothetical protein